MPHHRNISDPNIHEPKGISTASAGVSYVSDGSGSGAWEPLGPAGIDMSALEARLESDILNGDFNPNALLVLNGQFNNVSSDTRIVFPVPFSARVEKVVFVLGGAITGANTVLSVLASSGGSMGPSTTVTQSGSAKGDTYVLTPTGNNTIADNGWFEVVNTAASTGNVPLGVSALLRVMNV